MHLLLVILSIVITLLVMIQSKWTGLSIVPNSNDFWKFERRGPEKILHQITIGIIVIFVIIALISYFLA